VIAGALEPARLNVGDYAQMQNVGGQYPIGEVFTEARRLEDLHGRVRVHAFGDTSFCVNRPATPITLVIEDGCVVQALESTDEFDRVLAQIRRDEGEVLVRELGLGLNRALTRERIVNDIGTYERMCGIHLSLGAKHHAYKKPGIKKKFAKHHVDVFLVVDEFFLDGMRVYGDGEWCVLAS
jgi:leucyl aminopeptidase (aminopeptidase T)